MAPYIESMGVGRGLRADSRGSSASPSLVGEKALAARVPSAVNRTGTGMACAIRGKTGQRLELELLEVTEWETTFAVAISSGSLRAVASSTVSRSDVSMLGDGLADFGMTDGEFRIRLGRRMLVSVSTGEEAAVRFNIAVSDAPHGAFDATILTDEFQVRELGRWLGERTGNGCLADSPV